jgi:transcriptional regulator with XRE-family HTH domain
LLTNDDAAWSKARRIDEKPVSPETAFGRVLRDARKSRLLLQDELGAKSGYPRTYIGQLERGEKSPSLRTLFNLAKTLQVTLTAIVRDTEKLAGT